MGEKIKTSFKGRPAIRNGAGAEGPYLMWEDAEGSWVEVACSSDDDHKRIDQIADSVEEMDLAIPLPFNLTGLPRGYGVSSINQDSVSGTIVYVGPVEPKFGHADAAIAISFSISESYSAPTGRSIDVNGLVGKLNESPRSPGVCVFASSKPVCVDVFVSDTGPYPDRSDEIPTLLAIAESLRFPTDFEDRSTWFASDEVFE